MEIVMPKKAIIPNKTPQVQIPNPFISYFIHVLFSQTLTRLWDRDISHLFNGKSKTNHIKSHTFFKNMQHYFKTQIKYRSTFKIRYSKSRKEKVDMSRFSERKFTSFIEKAFAWLNDFILNTLSNGAIWYT